MLGIIAATKKKYTVCYAIGQSAKNANFKEKYTYHYLQEDYQNNQTIGAMQIM